jgi:putative SOS response-associated peptidase YedK
MAGRLYIAPIDLQPLFADLIVDAPLVISPNLPPRQRLSAIRLEAGRPNLSSLFWGLTPPWLKVLDHAPHCARAEALESRPMFNEAFQARRCLIPVSGVYAWRSQAGAKQPYLITRTDRGPLLLAGLWSRFHTSLTEHTDSLALITVGSPTLLAPITERFPAVIKSHDAEPWLDPRTPMTEVRSKLSIAPGELLGAFPVSRRVNHPAYQEPACAHPIGPMLRQQD